MGNEEFKIEYISPIEIPPRKQMDCKGFEEKWKEPLTIGKDYGYWNKAYYEEVASLKIAELLSFDGKFARVRRYDLDTRRDQTVEIRRLQPIKKENKNETPSLY